MQSSSGLIVIALGANAPSPAGAPAETLRAALAALPDVGLRPRYVSPFYQTPAYPPGAGPDYVNAAAVLIPDCDWVALIPDADWVAQIADGDLAALSARAADKRPRVVGESVVGESVVGESVAEENFAEESVAGRNFAGQNVAEEILRRLHLIEARFDRQRPVRWGPRSLDLDLLAVDEVIAPDAEAVRAAMAQSDAEAMAAAPEALVLPHPRMHRRGFVLTPAADVAPDWRHPLLGRTIRELRDALPEDERASAAALPPR